MVKSYQDLKEKCLGMVAFFETSNGYPECYGVTSGNWDGALISHGVLQYNLKTGTLQPLWNHMNDNHNQLCRDIFGADYQEWVDHINADFTTQETWANDITDPTNAHKTIEPWNTYFATLGTSEPSIAKQIELSQSYHDMALIWFNRLGLYSRRAYALIFDIAVQMGRLLPQNLIWMDFQNIDPTSKTREEIEIEKLRIIVQRVSREENNVEDPTIQDIVFKRKSAVVDGFSAVGFDISQYDLEFDPAFKGGIFSGN
jgi:hypothetical protein